MIKRQIGWCSGRGFAAVLCGQLTKYSTLSIIALPLLCPSLSPASRLPVNLTRTCRCRRRKFRRVFLRACFAFPWEQCTKPMFVLGFGMGPTADPLGRPQCVQVFSGCPCSPWAKTILLAAISDGIYNRMDKTNSTVGDFPYEIIAKPSRATGTRVLFG